MLIEEFLLRKDTSQKVQTKPRCRFVWPGKSPGGCQQRLGLRKSRPSIARFVSNDMEAADTEQCLAADTQQDICQNCGARMKALSHAEALRNVITPFNNYAKHLQELS